MRAIARSNFVPTPANPHGFGALAFACLGSPSEDSLQLFEIASIWAMAQQMLTPMGHSL
jgi:hypothetical protein